MTVEFRVLPVQEAVSWIRAWTDREWPMGLQEAFGIRDRLGWRPAVDDGRFFTTKLSCDGRDDGFIDRVDKYGNVKGVSIPLSSRGGRWGRCDLRSSCAIGVPGLCRRALRIMGRSV